MRLEKAEQHTARSAMTLREALNFRAAIDAGVQCARCSQKATARIGGEYLCAADAKVIKQRRERAAMKARA